MDSKDSSKDLTLYAVIPSNIINIWSKEKIKQFAHKQIDIAVDNALKICPRSN